jgi:predicted Holliday junction resolvase-like endonuclease
MRRLKELKDELKKAQSGLKSAFVRFGKSFEHFVPFIKNFPADKEKTVFLGMPIDFISFDNDYIKFIEVKTGNSQLSPKQNRIKKMIEKGLVKFKEVRY